MSEIRKLAILAGGGDLPVRVAQAAQAKGIPVVLVGFEGHGEAARLEGLAAGWVGLGEIKKILKLIEGASHLVFAGKVTRPDFKTLKLDTKALRLTPRLAAAAARGDGALLDLVRDIAQEQGFDILSPADILKDLGAQTGAYGHHQPSDRDLADIAKGIEVALALGALDVAQGAVVADGLVLALEAAEGTDAMLARIPDLPPDMRGTAGARRGVLVKVAKPSQDRRMDQPTIGPQTVERAAAAGLAGIAIDARAGLVVDRDETVALADRLGLFVTGVDVE